MESNSTLSSSTTADPSSLPPVHEGIAPVEGRARSASALDQFWIWAGANLAPITWILGSAGIALGLTFWQTLCVIVIGNALGSVIFGLFCVMGHRTGVNAMVLARLVLGRRGARLMTAFMIVMPMGWVGVNTWIVLDLALAALERMGIPTGDVSRYLVAATIMLIQIVITAVGFTAIQKFERWTMPIILVIMALMTIMAIVNVTPDPAAMELWKPGQWPAISAVMAAVGIGWGVTWFVYAADFSRFASAQVSSRRVFWSSTLGMLVPVIWLGTLGAFIASSGSGSDPAQLVVAAFGAMSLPVLLAIIHGPIATNIVVMYSAVLAVLSSDLRAAQWKIAIAGGVVGTGVLWLFLQSDSFAQAASEWMGAIVFLVSPWATITLLDFFVLRRSRLDVPRLYRPYSRRWVDDVNWPGVTAMALGLVAGWLFLASVPALTGPLAAAVGGIDLSWLSGSLVAGVTYYVLVRRGFGRVGDTEVAASGAPTAPTAAGPRSPEVERT